MTYLVIITLLVIGMSLITVEALTPGVHVFGIAGGLMVLGAIAYAGLKHGFTAGAVTFAASAVLFVVLVGVAIKSGTWRRLALETEQRKEQGYRTDNTSLTRHVGREGTVLNDLRPVGYVEVGGERIEAVSESAFVSKGSPVQVVRVDGVRLVVRPKAAEPSVLT